MSSLQHCVAVAFNKNQSTQEHSPQTFEHINPDHLQSLLNPLHAERDSDWDLHSSRSHNGAHKVHTQGNRTHCLSHYF